MDTLAAAVPAVPQIRIGAAGAPAFWAVRCADCGQALPARPLACPRCASRTPMAEFPLEGPGTLYNWRLVHRSFPGVPVPVIQVVVDMAEGLTLRGNLEGVAPDPAALAFDLPVRLAFRESDQRDAAGHPFLVYTFVQERGA